MNTPSIGSIFHAPEVIAFAGDWHANFLWAKRAVAHAQDNEATVILHTGDFGYDYIGSFIPALEEELRAADILLMVVRGNHDNPDYLDDLADNDQGFKPISDHIWYIPQGTAWSWDGVKFLGLGGAHSIDQGRRREGVSWWRRETISTVDMYRAVYRGDGADVMLTHDCPAGVLIPGLDKNAGWDPRELALSHRHRERLYEVVRRVQPKLLVHGHYHIRYQGFLNHTRIIGLDCDDRTIVNNMAFATLEDFKNGEFNARS